MRISLVPFLVQIVMLVAASPVAELETRADDTCHGGDTYCCNSSPVLGDETTGFLPVPINVLLGLQCSPLTVLGIVLGTTCIKTTVCCQKVNQNGLTNVGCIGIIVGV